MCHHHAEVVEERIKTKTGALKTPVGDATLALGALEDVMTGDAIIVTLSWCLRVVTRALVLLQRSQDQSSNPTLVTPVNLSASNTSSAIVKYFVLTFRSACY
jgi:hypothetical protein